MNESIAAEPVASIGRATLRKAAFRILPLLGLGYGFAYIDRLNISFAALEMNRDLRFWRDSLWHWRGPFLPKLRSLRDSCEPYLGANWCSALDRANVSRLGCDICGNDVLCNSPVGLPAPLSSRRCGSGLFPGSGILFEPPGLRLRTEGRAISGFFISYPIAGALMGITAGAILNMKGILGLAGWQWLFLLEGVPAVLLGFVVSIWLADRPRDAAWLTRSESDWLESQLDSDAPTHFTAKEVFDVIVHPIVLLLGAINFPAFGNILCIPIFLPRS